MNFFTGIEDFIIFIIKIAMNKRETALFRPRLNWDLGGFLGLMGFRSF